MALHDSMRELIRQLRDFEELARQTYRRAAEQIAEDHPFSAFCHGLADDEARHARLLEDLSRSLEESAPVPLSQIHLDPATQSGVAGTFQRCHQALVDGVARQNEIIETIAITEKSPWNPAFRYVIEVCQPDSRAAEEAAVSMQQHQDRIARYLRILPERLVVREPAGKLPSDWRPRYLVVDDDEALREFVVAMFEGEAEVAQAADGQAALDLIRKHHFDVVLCDLDMPRLNGIEFFKQAAKEDRKIRGRFIFWTGRVSQDLSSLCRDTEIPLLAKPTGIATLEQAVKQVANRRQAATADEP